MFCLNENSELTAEMNGGGAATFFVDNTVLNYRNGVEIFKITFQFINNHVEEIMGQSGCFYLTKGFGNMEIMVLSDINETNEFKCDFNDEKILVKQ